MSKPTLLSVIMANYNHAHYIGEALRAILSQSFRLLEVIVVDDGSTDDSLAVIEQIANQDPIIRLLRNGVNKGVVYSGNRGLEHASGDYIYAAAADDRVLAGLFEKSMNLLRRYPQAGLCCSDPAYFDSRTGTVRTDELRLSDEPCYFSPDELVGVMRSKSIHIACHSSVVKRSALVEAGGFVPELRWHCDWFALLVISFRHGICYIPEPLAAMRVSAGSYSSSGGGQWSAQREVLTELVRVLKCPAYRDVSHLFWDTCALAGFGSRIIRVLLIDRENWERISFRLIRRALWNDVRGPLARIAPSVVKRLYRRMRGLCSGKVGV